MILSYNVQEVRGDELTAIKDANLMNTLAGKVAGVNINASSAGVGGATRVVMRGIKSISSNNNALYVIDGIPIYNDNKGGTDDEYSGQPRGEGISDLNPDDIESISVLSGPAASALYGSSAAQGVILITTKKGKEGATHFEYSNNTTFSTPVFLPKFQNRYSNRPGEFKSWGQKNSQYRYDPADFFQTGSNVNNSLTFSTGTQKNQTFASVAANNSQGVLPNNNYERYNFTIRNTAKFLNDKMTLDLGASYIIQKQRNMVAQGLYYNPLPSLYLYPRGEDFNEIRLFEEYDEARNIYVQRWPWGNQGLSLENPYWEMNRKLRENKKQRYMFHANLQYDILDWLNVSGRIRIDNSSNVSKNKYYATTDTYWTQGSDKGSFSTGRTNDKQAYADILLNINKTIEDFSISANIGVSFNEQSSDGSGYGGPLKDMPNFWNLYNIDKIYGSPSQTGWKERAFAYFGSAELGWKNMLYLTLTARNEWSSTLANTKAEKSGYFFPSVGLSGVISEMVKLPSFIDFMKVRASYANVGSPIPRGLSQPGYTWDDKTQTWNPPTHRPLGELYPERTYSWEAGLNMRLLNNRINIDLTWYTSDTKKQTFEVATSAASGYSSMYIQAGNVRNKGMEIAVGYNDRWGDFGWSTNLTYSYNKNKIIELLENYYDPETDEYYTIPYLDKPGTRLVKGGSIGDIYVSAQFKRDQEGHIWIDPNTKNVVKEELTEPKKVGSFLPKGNLGWRNQFTYKDISFTALFTARFGGQVLSMTQAFMDEYGVSEVSAQAREAGGIWVNNNYVDAEGYYAVVGGRGGIGSEYIYNATNVRLQELSVSYMLPSKWFKNKMKMSVSLIGRNLWMIYNKAPFDPENTASTGTYNQGRDFFMQPNQRNLGFSLKLQF
ncbi:MAG: SusC/RagA family TonB-linked outer membrane protein [Bacteroidales bacterium]|nr:SusC/RagA family TonB-linked outer membrane protein [Bacteroidales bacterium]